MMLNVSEIINTVKKLIEIKIEILKSDIKEKISDAVTRIAILTMMVIVSVLILLFSSIALAFYFAEITYSNSLGFLYVGLIYVAILIILYIIKDSKSIQRGIFDALNKILFLSKSNRNEDGK
ncbi:hypothetical protein GCM10028791_23690 [Echinicola sediminis]